MLSKPVQACVNCHFLVKEARGLAPDPITLEVRTSEREQTRIGDYSWTAEHYALACHFVVWDEGHNFDRQHRHEVLVATDRRNFCFWWRHRPGMLIPAAKILQEREANTREASRDRRLTLYGLWIAAVALVANVWLTVAEKLTWWPFR